MGMVPWVSSIVYGTQRRAKHVNRVNTFFVHKIIEAPQIFFDSIDLSHLADQVQDIVKDGLLRNPDTELFIFPESSFDRVNLASAKEIATQWDSLHVGKPVHLLIGAYGWEGVKYHNTVYWVYDGQIKGAFNKRHSMVLAEGISHLWDCFLVRSLYFSNVPPVSPSTNERPQFLIDDHAVVPYICSELFFNDKPDDTYPNATIIAVCNDVWAQLSFVRRLMYLTARFKAIEWQRDIIYAAYFYGVYCDKNGGVMPLRTIKKH